MSTTARRLLIALGLLVGAGLWFARTREEPTTTTTGAHRAAPPPVEGPDRTPPTVAALEAAFQAQRADYEAQRDLVLALDSPDVTLQTDFLAWGEGERRTEMTPGHWWAPGETWYDRAEVLTAAGLDAASFDHLVSFLVAEDVLALRKVRGPGSTPTWVEFVPRQGHLNSRVQRMIVWHEDAAPRSEETQARISETSVFPQRMRETPLAAEGWFVRETVMERP